MIVGAIEALKERNGSSKTAIAKYISSNFKDLPPTHDALLSRHLGRLKKLEVLQMVGKSYTLAGSGKGLDNAKEKGGSTSKRGRPSKKSTVSNDINPGIEKKRRGRPRKVPTQEGTGLSSEKRKPGRPRKSLPTAELILPRKLKSLLAVEKRKPGRPKKGSSSVIATALGEKRKPGRPKKVLLQLKPTLAAFALGEKRKRGRPKKLAGFILGEERKQDQPENRATSSASVEKRKPGRPKKLAVNPALVGKRKPGRPKIHDASPTSVGKRKPGRPKKLDSNPVLVETLNPGQHKKNGAVLVSGEKKHRGRPKKHSTDIATSEKRKQDRPKINLSAPLALGGKRKRGRPMRNSLPFKPEIATMSASGEKRRRGRPKKLSAVTGDGGENFGTASMAQTQFTPGEVSSAFDSVDDDNLPAILVALTRGGVSAAVENGGGIPPKETSSLSKKAVRKEAVGGSTVSAPLHSVTESGEKRKRGRPKKTLTTSSYAAVNNGGDGRANPVPSATPKRRGRPPKISNPVIPGNSSAIPDNNPAMPGNSPAPHEN